MIFRLSQKLSTKIKAGTLGALALHENPLADWSAHVFVAGRTQYILLSNTKSLYSTVLYGKGITNDSQFIERAVSSIREVMADGGLEIAFRRFIAPASSSVRFAKALDRSVTGSMNDLINHATAWLADGDVAPRDVGSWLNDRLLSALAISKAFPYGKPREAFQALLDKAETSTSSSEP
jgi:hypothetical protein